MGKKVRWFWIFSKKSRTILKRGKWKGKKKITTHVYM